MPLVREDTTRSPREIMLTPICCSSKYYFKQFVEKHHYFHIKCIKDCLKVFGFLTCIFQFCSENSEPHRRNYHEDDEDVLGHNIREEDIREDLDYEDNVDNSEDEVEGEDLMENMEQDYR